MADTRMASANGRAAQGGNGDKKPKEPKDLRQRTLKHLPLSGEALRLLGRLGAVLTGPHEKMATVELELEDVLVVSRAGRAARVVRIRTTTNRHASN